MRRWVLLLACLAVALECTTAGDAQPTKAVCHDELRVIHYSDPLPQGAIARLGTALLQHGGPVWHVAYALGGQALVSGGIDGAVRVWDSATGKELRAIHPGFEFVSAARPWQAIAGPEQLRMAVSGDGLTLVTVNGRELTLWDLATGSQMRQVGDLSPYCTCVAISPDGRIVAVASDDEEQIQLLAAPDGKALRQLGEENQRRTINALAFSSDGRTLASAVINEGVHLWDVESGKELGQLQDPPPRVGALCFSPDGKYLACGAGSADRWPFPNRHGIALWNPATGKRVRRLADYTVNSLAFSPDGKRLAAPRLSDGIRVWDLDTAQEKNYSARSVNLQAICFSPDGKLIAGGARDGRIHLWDVATASEVPRHEGHRSPVSAVAFDPGGKMLASLGSDDAIRLWRMPGGEELRCFGADADPFPPGKYPASMVFSANGQKLLVASDECKVLAVDTGRVLRGLGQNNKFVRASFVSGGRILACVDAKGGVELRDTFSDARLARIEHVLEPWDRQAWSLSPHGELIAAAQTDFNLIRGGQGGALIALWQTDSGTQLRRLILDEAYRADGITFSADGKMLAAVAGDVIWIYDLATGRMQRTMKHGNQDEVARLRSRIHDRDKTACLTFSPNGRVLASCCGQTIHLWDVLTCQECSVLIGHAANVECLTFDPSSRFLASGSADTSLLVWDLDVAASAGGHFDNKLDALWADLASMDARQAFRAVWALARHRRHAVAFLRPRLEASFAVTLERIRQLIGALDSDSFDERERAAAALEALGELARLALKKEMARPASQESARQAKALLDRLSHPLSPNHLRLMRAIEVLEHIRTPEAKELLRALASRTPDTVLTREARSALARLEGL